MHLPLPLLLGFAVVLGLWFTWLALRRANRQRLALRLLALWGVVACLVLLLEPPSVTQTYHASEAILLTQGYSPDTLRALQKRLQPKPQVYHFAVEAEKAEAVSDFTAFQEQHPAVKTLHVLGHGLSAEDIRALDSVHLVPHLAPLPTGVVTASWPQKVILGEELQVQGTFHAVPERGAKLVLRAAGRARDSVEAKKGTEQPFRFRFTPKTTGRFVYALSWTGEDDSVYQEAIPVEVVPPRPLNVLLLGAAPSFESRFLKNFLASQGHGVAIRNQVSKGIYQTELVNLPTLRLDRLTPSLLQRFDVVALDEATLKSLTAAERQTLQQAVRQQGLGVLTIFPGDAPKAIPFFAEAVFRQVSQKQAKNEAVRWTGQTSGQAVLSLPGLRLQAKEGQKPLAWAQNPSQPLAVRYRKGMGQVGVSLVQETFPLALEGKEALYQQYWANVLTALAKPVAEEAVAVEPYSAAAKVDHPVALVLSSESSPPVVELQREEASAAPSPFYVTPSGLVPNTWRGAGWPKESGWSSFASPEGKKHFLYFYPESSWSVQGLAHQQKLLLKANAGKRAAGNRNAFQVREQIPLWPIAMAVLFLLGFLWLEEKV